MKKFLAGAMVGCVLAMACINTPSVQIYNADELTAEVLENRNGNIIIERVLGVVTDAENGHGCELNGSYISYKSVDGISNGDMVCTYLIYNPNTNCIDDIAARYDYVMK